jgi:hypothetical protein
MAEYPIGFFDDSKGGAWQYPVCQRHVGHDGKHRAHKAYGGVEWETSSQPAIRDSKSS